MVTEFSQLLRALSLSCAMDDHSFSGCVFSSEQVTYEGFSRAFSPSLLTLAEPLQKEKPDAHGTQQPLGTPSSNN